VDQPPIIQLAASIWFAILAHSSLLCYFIVFLHQIKNASVLSTPLPFMVFLWGSLTIPRPSKTFWVTLIAYVEVSNIGLKHKVFPIIYQKIRRSSFIILGHCYNKMHLPIGINLEATSPTKLSTLRTKNYRYRKKAQLCPLGLATASYVILS